MNPEEGPLRIVAIGGGTGLATLLRGLKPYAKVSGVRSRAHQPSVDITAVVTVTDDGGSSGRLRRAFDVPPPGDIRNCMVALSEDEALLSRLFQYRFNSGIGLKGHSFGNLFVTALSEVTGDFTRAVTLSCEVLASSGRIYPSTESNVTLKARLASGAVVAGESRISRSSSPIQEIQLDPRECRPLPETLKAIAEADLITLGPGSLYTSVIPNVLVKGIPEAIRKSPALKAYIVNLMWQPGETINYTAADHVAAIDRHAGARLLDYVVVNTKPIPESALGPYAQQQAHPVAVDADRLRGMGLHVVEGEFLDESHKVRHNPATLAPAILQLAEQGRRQRT